MMPGYAGDIDVMGIKVISVFPKNKDFGHSSHQGVVVLFEAKNGRPLCIADADEITAIRTPAASAVATNLLARKDAEILSILGSGTQAAGHIEAMLLVRKIKKIIVWSRNETHDSGVDRGCDRFTRGNQIHRPELGCLGGTRVRDPDQMHQGFAAGDGVAVARCIQRVARGRFAARSQPRLRTGPHQSAHAMAARG